MGFEMGSQDRIWKITYTDVADDVGEINEVLFTAAASLSKEKVIQEALTFCNGEFKSLEEVGVPFGHIMDTIAPVSKTDALVLKGKIQEWELSLSASGCEYGYVCNDTAKEILKEMRAILGIKQHRY
jgi:hypothetical protein